MSWRRSVGGTLDPAVRVVVAASSERLLRAVTNAINAEREQLLGEGHGAVLLASACISASASLLANALITQTAPCCRLDVWQDSVVRISAVIDDSMAALPAGGTVQ